MADREVWTTRQAAIHCGIRPATYRDYTRTNGAPGPLEYRSAGGELLFDADAVRAWHANRPGRGSQARFVTRSATAHTGLSPEDSVERWHANEVRKKKLFQPKESR